MKSILFHPTMLLNIQNAPKAVFVNKPLKNEPEKMLLKNSCRNVNIFIANMYGSCLNKKFKKYNCGSCDIKMSQLWSSECNLEFMSISFSAEATPSLHHSITLPDLASRNSTLVHLTALKQSETELEMHFSRSWPFWKNSGRAWEKERTKCD